MVEQFLDILVLLLLRKFVGLKIILAVSQYHYKRVHHYVLYSLGKIRDSNIELLKKSKLQGQRNAFLFKNLIDFVVVNQKILHFKRALKYVEVKLLFLKVVSKFVQKGGKMLAYVTSHAYNIINSFNLYYF